VNEPMQCAAVRPLLFAGIDGALDRSERIAVHAHLAACAPCRAWQDSERELTALLHGGRAAPVVRRRRLPRAVAFAAACAACAAVLLVLPAATPAASVVQRRLGPALEWQAGAGRPLASGDVVDVPAAGAASVSIGDDVRLESVGPARFALAAHGSRWVVSVLAGTVVATVAASRALGVDGGEALGAGRWRLAAGGRPQPADRGGAPQDPADPAALLAEGLDRFGRAGIVAFGVDRVSEQEHLAAAERTLRAVLGVAGATAAQRQRAHFYLAASVSRLGRTDEAFALNRDWLRTWPDGDEASCVRFFVANHLREHGPAAEARALFERVIRDEGDTPLGTAARRYLEMMEGAPAPAAPGAPPQQPRPGAIRLTATRAPVAAGAAKGGGYLVVPVALDRGSPRDAGFLAAAAGARTLHRAAEWAWDGTDFDALARELRARAPENVLFVLRPEQLDLALHRRLLLLSAAVDDDWFVDFAFGYLTGDDGAGCERTWRRIAALHARGPLQGLWWQGSVTSNATSLEYADSVPPLAAAAGFHGPHYYWSTANADRDALIAKSLATLRTAAVAEFTGCGDPQGIWLFDDDRNRQRDKHWPYDPARVGHDPDASMPRLLAKRFRELELASPIVWSGTCHSGATCRVFVEADIVSTFGRTDRTTVHRLVPDDSLALSWLAAGAAALLVPLGANHGMSVAMETDFALRNGASLGEALKSTWDDVLLAARGQLVLDVPADGEPHRDGEQVMQGGGSNRILIGDPALRPFRAVTGDAESVAVQRTGAGLRVTVTRAAGWQPRAWDMFGGERDRDWRVLARVDLGELALAGSRQFDVGVAAQDPGGKPLPYTMQRVAIEDHHGRRWLHLQANGPRAQLDRQAATIVFDVVAK
jgi:hypothetical protein